MALYACNLFDNKFLKMETAEHELRMQNQRLDIQTKLIKLFDREQKALIEYMDKDGITMQQIAKKQAYILKTLIDFITTIYNKTK